MEQGKRIEISRESLERRVVAWHTSNEGKCWWVYQYLSAPPFKAVTPLEVGFAQKDFKWYQDNNAIDLMDIRQDSDGIIALVL